MLIDQIVWSFIFVFDIGVGPIVKVDTFYNKKSYSLKRVINTCSCSIVFSKSCDPKEVISNYRKMLRIQAPGFYLNVTVCRVQEAG